MQVQINKEFKGERCTKNNSYSKTKFCSVNRLPKMVIDYLMYKFEQIFLYLPVVIDYLSSHFSRIKL